MSDESAEAGRAFVLGLDGVPWPLLRDWVDDGHLPNFSRLFESGATGPLESTEPATTPVAWPSIFTGLRPDGHGVYAFHETTADHTRQLNTNTNVGGAKLWDRVSPAVVVNVPMTYPAREVDGTMVTGMMSPGITDEFTHPPELAEEIRERVPDYEIGLKWYEYHGDVPALVTDLEAMVAARWQLVSWLLEETADWRLAFTVFTAPDRLQHLCWDEETLLSFYGLLDDVLGDVMAVVDDADATLYVVSDHGFGPIDRSVAPNTVLAEEGLLTPKGNGNARGLLERVGLTREAVLAGLDRVGIDEDALVRYLPESLVHMAGEQLPGDHALYDVDFGETVAFVGAHGTVYVNTTDRFDEGAVTPDDVPAVKRAVTDALDGVCDPETGARAVTVHDGDDLFPRDDDSPDLLLEYGEDYTSTTSLRDERFGDSGTYAATHRSQGIFLAWGANVDPGVRVTGAHVTDVAPTVLHGTGTAVPDVDGRVLNEVFAPGTSPATTPVRVADDHAEREQVRAADDTGFDDVEERLQGLGYID